MIAGVVTHMIRGTSIPVPQGVTMLPSPSGAPLPTAPKPTPPPAPDQPLPVEALHPLKLKFEVLGGWTYVEGKTAIPEDVKKLDGKWVEISGFMLPINEINKMSNFIILQSLWGCCFGQAPAVNHVIVTTMVPGRTVEFYPDPVKVIGKFSVGETREKGYLVSIYRLEAYTVTAAHTPNRQPPPMKSQGNLQ